MYLETEKGERDGVQYGRHESDDTEKPEILEKRNNELATDLDVVVRGGFLMYQFFPLISIKIRSF